MARALELSSQPGQKAEVALAKGKKAHDKRATVREREAKKEVARAMKHYKR